MFEVRHVGFRYGKVPVLTDVSLDIGAGEVVALLGPNGAGKSTLVSLLVGARKPTSGEVLLDGRAPTGRRSVRHRVGWVPQGLTLYPRLTVDENLRAMGRIMGVKVKALEAGVERALRLTGLAGKRDLVAATLSGGQQRLLNVGMGLVHGPDVLILDEPTAGVDQAASVQLKRVIRELREQGLAILLTTHELEDANELADRLVILVDGVIRASGATDQVVHTVFSDSREIGVVLAPIANDQREVLRCQDYLAAAGLVSSDSGQRWHGLLDNGEQQVDRLMHQLLGYGDLIRELRVRKPGLELLINKFSEQRAAA